IRRMTAPREPRESQRLIRRRLFWLLLRAFFIVVSLTVLMLLGLFTGLAGLLTRGGGAYTPPEVRDLEAYYAGHGSWDGVGVLLAPQSTGHSPIDPTWRDVTVLDQAGRIVIDNGRADGRLIGPTYAGPEL